MLSHVSFAIRSIGPIVLVIVLGYFLQKQVRLSKDVLNRMSGINYRIGLGPLLFCSVYSVGSLKKIPWKLGGYSLVSLAILTAAGFVVAYITTKDVRRRPVLVHAMFWSNMGIIGLPLAEALVGPEGVVVASAVQAPAILFFNFTGVLVSAWFSKKSGNMKKTLYQMITNPFIVGISLALVCLWIEEAMSIVIFDPIPWLYETISMLSKMGTPLALLLLGMQLEFSIIRNFKKELFVGIISRLVIAPLLGFGMAFLAGEIGWIEMTSATIAALIAMYGSPGAIISVMLASEMDGDQDLSAQILVWSSVLSIFTIVVMIVFFRNLGYF